MIPVKAGNIRLGDGTVKICVPLAYENKCDILRGAEEIAENSCADIAELRVDWYKDVFSEEALSSLLSDVRKRLKDKPLLVTFRSRKEGGEKEADADQYQKTARTILNSGCADMLDIELSMGEELVSILCREASQQHAVSVVSKHDFNKTPSCSEMVDSLETMLRCGADICKLAVMPHCSRDTAVLMEATAYMHDLHPDKPLITMSMGEIGAVSRIGTGCFGNVMTFGTLGKSSAPGQIDARILKRALVSIEECLER